MTGPAAPALPPLSLRPDRPNLPDQRNAHDAATRARAEAAGTTPENWLRTRRTAEEFEGQFLTQMLSHLFENVEVDETFGGGHAEEMFRSLLVDQYGKQMTRAGGIGIADAVQKQILSMQEV
ncbi:MAG TPA: rod-binding protein [Arenibaculum sp.]|nr:rod-binding protein [Arenibaculum sp.]